MPSRAAIPVTVATSVVSAIAGSARLPTITGCTNSTATCWASALAPPVPKTTSLPPRWKRTAIAWQASATAAAWPARLPVGATRRSNNRAAPPVSAIAGRRKVDLDLDVHGVSQLQRAEHARVRLDAELRLDHGGGRPVAAAAGLADGQREWPGLAMQRQRAIDRAAAAVVRRELRGGECRLRIPVGLELLKSGQGDLAAVPVRQRLEAAGPLPDHQGPQVDPRLEAFRSTVVTVQFARPLRDLDHQVVPSLSRQATPVC